jgi:hypothetical protein
MYIYNKPPLQGTWFQVALSEHLVVVDVMHALCMQMMLTELLSSFRLSIRLFNSSCFACSESMFRLRTDKLFLCLCRSPLSLFVS